MDRIQTGYYNYQFVPDVLLQRLAALQGCLPAKSRLIDLGCNDGTISLVLLESGHAASSLGIDFEDVRRAAPPGFDFIATDLRHFDLDTLPEVDVVLCLNVIHHLCKNGIDFARDFMARLATRAGTVICEMGSLTAKMDATKMDTSWLDAMRAEWQTDEQCWADLFQAYAWRRPLMTYPFQFGRRVMWKLISDREPAYEFDLLTETVSPQATIRHLRRKGTQELFWSKAYHGATAQPDAVALRHEVHCVLKNAPYDCLLPLTSTAEHGDIYAYDSEVAAGMALSPETAMKDLSPEEYRELLGFAARPVAGLRDYPLDMLCDFRVARTSRGLTFLHFEPHEYALKLLGGSAAIQPPLQPEEEPHPLSALTLELTEPFRIVVENRLNTITPYILLEQESWFEAEVPLARAFLQPGMRVVDIGANCGFYTLLAAQRVGSEGHVWSFEPSLKPTRLLKESLRLNGFDNVTLYEAAAGLEPGFTWFQDNEMSEISAVVAADTPGARRVTVESLDHLYGLGQLHGVDWVKIDAEGFEEQVILGGKAFFDAENPVVMLEVNSGMGSLDFGPAEILQRQGYQPYRYNAAIGCLAPPVMGKVGDLVLNIFLCKPQRAAALREAGLLVTCEDLEGQYSPAAPELFTTYFSTLAVVRSCPWLASRLEAMRQPEAASYGAMCAELLLSEDTTLPVAERLVRLRRAETWIDTQFSADIPPSIILSLPRLVAACGRSSVIGGLLDIANSKIGGSEAIGLPFLPVSPRWANLPAENGDFISWLRAMMADEKETFRTTSSFYDCSGTRAAYDLVRRSGHLDAALERRAALSNLVRDDAPFPEPAFIAREMPRNRAIWNEIATRLARGEKNVHSLDVGYKLGVATSPR